MSSPPVVMYTDDSPFEMITGFALGAQVDPTDTNSTCYGQALMTKQYYETIFAEIYDMFVLFNINTISNSMANIL
jgi:hypothetical protein